MSTDIMEELELARRGPRVEEVFGARAVIATARHAAPETGALAQRDRKRRSSATTSGGGQGCA